MWKVMQKDVWPWFSRSYNEDRIFSLSPLDSLTPKTYPWEIFSKKSDGKAKIQGVVPTPLGVFDWRNTLGIWGLNVKVQKLVNADLQDKEKYGCLKSESIIIIVIIIIKMLINLFLQMTESGTIVLWFASVFNRKKWVFRVFWYFF